MSKFLLFCKRTRAFLKYRFLTYKFHFLKFLGKFITYFKLMSQYAEDEIVGHFNDLVIRNTNQYDKGFSVEHFTPETFSHTNKSCSIMYHIDYKKDNANPIRFQILLNVNNKPLPLFGLFEESCNEDIFEFYRYLLNLNDNNIFYWYMDHLKK